MHILRKMTLGVVASLLVTTLFLFGLSWGLLQVFGSPDSIKHALSESGIYQSVVSDALKQAQKEQEQKSGEEDQLPVDSPEIQRLIGEAATPELLQTKTEGAIDGLYAWIQGKTPKLEIAVDLRDVKTNFADGLERYVAEHVASLPTCRSGDDGNIEDPFNATCRPKGIDSAELASEAKSKFLEGKFLKDTTLSTADLKAKDGKTIEEQFQAVPMAYQGIVWGVIGTGALALLLALGVLFLSVNRRSGLKKISIIFIVVGSIGVLMSWLIGAGLDWAAKVPEEPLQKSGFKVGEVLAGDLRNWWMWYGVMLVVLGVVTLVVLRITKKKESTNGPTHELAKEKNEAPEQPAVTAEPTSEGAVAPIKPKPTRPTRKLVQ